MDVSNEAYEALKFIEGQTEPVCEDQIPSGISRDTVIFLCTTNLLRCRDRIPPPFSKVVNEYRLTPRGREAILQYEQVTKQRAEDEERHSREKQEQREMYLKDKRRNNVQWTVALVVAIILSFFAGVLGQWGTSFVDKSIEALKAFRGN